MNQCKEYSTYTPNEPILYLPEPAYFSIGPVFIVTIVTNVKDCL